MRACWSLLLLTTAMVACDAEDGPTPSSPPEAEAGVDAERPEDAGPMEPMDAESMEPTDAEPMDVGPMEPVDADPTGPMDSGPSMGDAAPGAPDRVVLEIPMRPRHGYTSPFVLLPNEAREDADDRQTYLQTLGLVFAIEPAYPTAFTVSMPGVTVAAPCLNGEGPIVLDAVESEGVTARLLNGDSFLIEDIQAGAATVTARGTIQPTAADIADCGDAFPEGVETRVEFTYRIEGIVPTGITTQPQGRCPGALPRTLVADGPARRGFDVKLVDADGRTFSPNNVEHSHPMNLILTAPPEARLLDEDRSHQSLHLGPSTGTLMVQADFGDPVEVEIIGADQIVDWSPNFSLAGQAGGGIPQLADGETYGEGGWGRTTDRIVPTIIGLFSSAAGPLCIDPNPGWFVLMSETPETCVLSDEPASNALIRGEPVGLSARLVADGECRLVLSAPDLNGGQGLRTTISAAFVDVDLLLSL